MMKILFFLMLIFSVSNLYAQSKFPELTVDEKPFDGFDLISFFEGRIEEGKNNITFTYRGIQLFFVSEENKKMFVAEPDRYYPEFNGWCAIGLAKGILRKPDYKQFKIQDNQVLFFEVKAFYNGKTDWNKNPEANKILADKNYVELTKGVD